MPPLNSITDRIQLLRARIKRYKVLAAALYDHRIAAEVEGFADELEAELARLETCQRSYALGNNAAAACAS
jgi:hypothetical protein